MSARAQRVAILFPADSNLLLATSLERSKFAEAAAALRAAGIEVTAAPYADEIASEVRERLSTVDGVMVWFNPIERGRDRAVLNAVLREVASQGAFVSAHPDVIDRIGTKEVLYLTRSMGWGCDTSFYESADAMRSGLPASIRSGKRVLKQIRGQSGDGIWLVAPASSASSRGYGAVLSRARSRRGLRRAAHQRTLSGSTRVGCSSRARTRTAPLLSPNSGGLPKAEGHAGAAMAE